MKQLILVLLIGFTFSVFAQEEKTAVDYNNEGVSAANAKDYKAAFVAFEKAIELYKNEGAEVSPDLIYGTGYSAFKAKKYAESIPYFEQAIEKDIKGATSYRYAAQASKAIKKYEDEEKFLTAGLAKYSDDKNLNILMGKVYFKKGYSIYKKANTKQKESNKIIASAKVDYADDADQMQAEFDKANAMKEEVKVEFKEAMPLLEKSYAHNKTSKNTLKTLINVYKLLEMTDKADKLNAELVALPQK